LDESLKHIQLLTESQKEETYQDGKCIFTFQCKIPSFKSTGYQQRDPHMEFLIRTIFSPNYSSLKQTHVIRQRIYASRIISLVSSSSKDSKQRKEEVDDVQIQGDRSPYVLIVVEPLYEVVCVIYDVATKYK